MIKAIVFDFDGVIVNSEPLHYRAFLKTAQDHGLPVDFSYDEYLAKYVGYDDRDARGGTGGGGGSAHVGILCAAACDAVIESRTTVTKPPARALGAESGTRHTEPFQTERSACPHCSLPTR